MIFKYLLLTAYLDITEQVSEKMKDMRENKFQLLPSSFTNTYAVGYENMGAFVQDVTTSVENEFDDVPEEDRQAIATSKLRLLIGAAIVNDIRNAVKQQTQYECSAGIAHNKILAKLTCGMNKPNKQTVLPIESVSGLFQNLAVSKVKNLGGKLGEEVCQKLNVKTMADLLKFTEIELQNLFQPRVGSWLYYMAKGIDLEKVTPKFLSKSIAVSKNFRGKNEISSIHTLRFWLKELAKEIVERLEKDAIESNRTSKHMIVSFTQGAPRVDTNNVASTRTVQLNGNSLNSYTAEQISDEAFETIKKNSKQFLKAEGSLLMFQNIKHLGISASKFEDNSVPSTSANLQDLLKNHKKTAKKDPPSNLKNEKETSTKPEPASIKTMKKFEMKSPKSMFAKASTSKSEAKPAMLEATVEPDTKATVSLTVTEYFAGDFAIRGIKSLKHWIYVIFDQFCGKLKDDSETNNRAPTEVYLKLEYLSHDQKKVKEIKVPLNEKIIDVDLLTKMILQSDRFLNDETNLIQLPIIQIDVFPANFEKGKTWIHSVKSLTSNNEPVNDTIASDIDELCDAYFLESDVDKLFDEQQASESKSNHVKEVNWMDESKNAEKTVEFETHELINSTNPTAAIISSSPIFDFSEESEDIKMNEEVPKDLEQNKIDMDISCAAETSESPNTSYSQYQPKALDTNLIELLNPKEECIMCGKMIGRLDMPIHSDHHLALQIATQQREEHRKQLKSNQPRSSNQVSAKKMKTTPKKPISYSIIKYATKTEAEDEMQDENKVKCAECFKIFSPEEYVSHLDYHYAKKLRDEEAKKVSVRFPKVDPKQKKLQPSKKNSPKVPSVKSYFTKNN